MENNPIWAAINSFYRSVMNLPEVHSNPALVTKVNVRYIPLKQNIFAILIEQETVEQSNREVLHQKNEGIDRLKSKLAKAQRDKMTLKKRLKEAERRIAVMNEPVLKIDQKEPNGKCQAECGVCYRAYNGAIRPVVGSCGHSICRLCKEFLQQGKKCPLCRKESSFKNAERNYLAEELLTLLHPETTHLEKEIHFGGGEDEFRTPLHFGFPREDLPIDFWFGTLSDTVYGGRYTDDEEDV